MSTVEIIRQKHRNGMTIAQICREEKVDYKTVKKYIEKEDFSEPLPARKEKTKVVDQYKDWIVQLLKENEHNWYKQKLTTTRILKLLKEEFPDATISYNSVNRFLNDYNKKNKKEAGFLSPYMVSGRSPGRFRRSRFRYILWSAASEVSCSILSIF